MGNNFCLLVDILFCSEPLGVVRLENTDNSTAKFQNLTLFPGSIFFFPFLTVEEFLALCEWDFSPRGQNPYQNHCVFLL